MALVSKGSSISHQRVSAIAEENHGFGRHRALHSHRTAALPPPESWRSPRFVAKNPGEMRLICKATGHSNTPHRFVASQQQLFRAREADGTDIRVRRHAEASPESSKEMACAQSCHACHILHPDRRLKVGMDVVDDLSRLPRRQPARRTMDETCLRLCWSGRRQQQLKCPLNLKPGNARIAVQGKASALQQRGDNRRDLASYRCFSHAPRSPMSDAASGDQLSRLPAW